MASKLVASFKIYPAVGGEPTLKDTMGCEVRDCEVNVDMVQSEIVGMTNKICEKMKLTKAIQIVID